MLDEYRETVHELIEAFMSYDNALKTEREFIGKHGVDETKWG